MQAKKYFKKLWRKIKKILLSILSIIIVAMALIFSEKSE